LREGLVVAEVALAMMLLIAAALFARSFLRISAAGAGFEAASVLSLRVELPGPAFGEDTERVRGVHEMLRRIESVPGVTAAAASGLTPLEEGGNGALVAIEGRTTRHGEEPGVFYAGVTPGFFRTLGAPLRVGRELTPEESDSGARFAVINETFANRFWPDVPALGKRFRLQQFATGDWLTVVGVVADFQNEEVRSPVKPSAYIAFGLDAGRNVGFLVKASGPPAPLAEPLRRAIHSAVPEAPVFGVLPMSEVVTANVWSDRLLGQLFGVFGAVAVLLAAVGVYGVLAYSVRQRRQEIGVRMALGADDRDVLRLVVGNGLGLAAVGIAGGLLGAFAATRVVASMLYNVSPTDPASFVLVSLFLVAVALTASYLPARAALAAQPVEALRHE
jgi:putative ABC transport system permease protein